MEKIIEAVKTLNKKEIFKILNFKDENQKLLFETARIVRSESKFRNFVELRSVIELSNICSQKCNYCSISKDDKPFFTLSKEVIIAKIIDLAKKGRKTFLLQSGENKNKNFINDVAISIKEALKTYPDLRFVLCFGNLSKDDFLRLKEAGAKRYILKFETSNPQHHKFCRPTDTIENRLKYINMLLELGYEVGSGNIVGLPEQTFDNLYDDLTLINELDLSMVSATRFISNPFSNFAKYPNGDIDLTLNFLAILRILKPNSLIPSTTSLSLDKQKGQYNGLMAGCNTITIHDGTPREFEEKYSIYSNKRFLPDENYCKDVIRQAQMEEKAYLL